MSDLPPHAAGMRIGLLGGSFNPPHEAHLLISKAALQRLQLDRVWWVISPGNPLKDTRELAPLEKRIEQANTLIDDRRIVPTDIEADLKTRYTVDTIRALQERCPGARFVWLMGADNLAQFHRWKDWRKIADSLPIAVFDRPDYGHKALRSRAALAMAGNRLDESDSGLLAYGPPPVWTFIHGPKSPVSSTALRHAKTSRK